MRITRLTSIILCIALLASALFGCGEDGSVSSGGEGNGSGAGEFFENKGNDTPSGDGAPDSDASGGGASADNTPDSTNDGTADVGASGGDTPADPDSTPKTPDDSGTGDTYGENTPQTPAPEPEPERAVDPADHIFPDLEAFLGLPLEKDILHGTRGRRWQFQDISPYESLEELTAELLALLQEPRWQLELVDEDHSVFETGDMNGSDTYYFKYTGTAELTLIEDSLGVRLDHVNVVFYHTAVYDKYSIDIFRSPELDAVDPGSRITSDVRVPTEEPEPDNDSQWREKCSSCHGSGKCTHCGGDGEVKKFQAGLGWVELDCTLCNRGKCRHCNGKGWD